MSFNGSGTFSINSSGQPVVVGTTISDTVFNALTADLATGLSTVICKDGQTTTTASIPFAQGIAVTGTTTFSADITVGATVNANSLAIRHDSGSGYSQTSRMNSFMWGEKDDSTNFRRRYYLDPSGAGASFANVMNLSGAFNEFLGGLSPGAPDATGTSAFSSVTMYCILGADPSGTHGVDNSICFRIDGSAGHRIFYRNGGSWTAWSTI